MAETAFQTQYRQEFIRGFEVRQSLLRDTTTTEAVIKGNQAVFLVADSGAASAVTRGVNGLIPARGDNLNQNTCTLSEQHDLVRKTGFNVFASQGNQRAIMQETTMSVLNRKIDDQILTELATATNDNGAATTASLAFVMRAKTILGNNKVPWDGGIFAVVTPAFEAYLMQTSEFASADYVDMKPLPGADAAWSDRQKAFRWAGVTWITHPGLSGVGTAAEICFMYHKTAIGHAADTAGLQTPVGYDEEQDYSWARATCYMGAKLLQNSGVVVMTHDGSAYVAT